MCIRALSTVGARIAGISGLGVFRTSVRVRCWSSGSKVHVHCGRNRAIAVSIPPEPQVVGSSTLPPIPPYCRSSGVHACCRSVYYSRCSLYITLDASHTIDRVSCPLIRNGHRSRPTVPHQNCKPREIFCHNGKEL